MCGMMHNFTIHRVQLREVYDWKINLSIVERSRLDRDRNTLLKLWDCQLWAGQCLSHWSAGAPVPVLRMGLVDEMPPFPMVGADRVLSGTLQSELSVHLPHTV